MGQSPGKKLVLLHFGSSKFANVVHDKFNNTTIQFLARFDSNGSRVPRRPKSKQQRRPFLAPPRSPVSLRIRMMTMDKGLYIVHDDMI